MEDDPGIKILLFSAELSSSMRSLLPLRVHSTVPPPQRASVIASAPRRLPSRPPAIFAHSIRNMARRRTTAMNAMHIYVTP